jgi:hypothetical protein
MIKIEEIVLERKKLVVLGGGGVAGGCYSLLHSLIQQCAADFALLNLPKGKV